MSRLLQPRVWFATALCVLVMVLGLLASQPRRPSFVANFGGELLSKLPLETAIEQLSNEGPATSTGANESSHAVPHQRDSQEAYAFTADPQAVLSEMRQELESNGWEENLSQMGMTIESNGDRLINTAFKRGTLEAQFYSSRQIDFFAPKGSTCVVVIPKGKSLFQKWFRQMEDPY